MNKAIGRWIMISLAALALGPALASLTDRVHDVWGGNEITAMLSATPALSVVLVMLAIIAAGAFGAVTARLTSAELGMFCAGVAMSWSAFNGATVEGLIRIAGSARPLWTLSTEAAGLGALTLGVSAFILKKGHDRRNDAEKEELFGSQAALGAGVSFLVAAIAGWVIAREGLPGQNIAAAGLAAMFAVAAGRTVAPGASILCCLAGVLAVGAVGPALGAILQGGGIVEASYSGTLFPLARLTPMDWVAGVWMGAPIGSVWAVSMIEKSSEQAPARAGA